MWLRISPFHTTHIQGQPQGGFYMGGALPQPTQADHPHQPAQRGYLSPDFSASDPWKVWQLLDNDGAVIEGGLAALGDGVGRQHGHQHGQRVHYLASQLEGQQRRGDGVGHGP